MDRKTGSLIGDGLSTAWSKGLHYVAGLILLAYGASHFGFLFLREPTHDHVNIVLPLFTNWSLYLIAGIVEITVGVLCLNMRGKSLTNVFILTFVATILWYRWAYHYAGGPYCGCTGLLGRLLRLSKKLEEIVPLATLGFLALSTTPWLYRSCKQYLSRLAIPATLLAVASMSCGRVLGEQTLEIRGLTSWQDYSPWNGQSAEQYQAQHEFVAFISGNAWSFRVVNRDRPQWWGELVFDGTDTYTIQPKTQYGFLAKDQGHVPETNLNEVLIEKSPRFLRKSDELNLSIGWLTYGLSRESVQINNAGFVDMPTPTREIRSNPRAFGYKWVIKYSEDGRYATTCEVIRERALDLGDQDELLRPEMDYPETLASYNEYMELLGLRKATPTGFVDCRYTCTAWIRTNGLIAPTASKLEVFWYDPGRGAAPFPRKIVTLTATNVVVHEGRRDLLPNVKVQTAIQDYRYKRASTERIFKYADYTLSPGDTWKTDKDPVLLAAAENHLQHGRKYAVWANRGRHWVIWLLLPLILAPAVVLSLKNKLGKERSNKS
ncbi:MAG TPA: hypothetical protein VFZ59_13700 [Verrucomicrobiae bacterium]|nr:hypothetical protein [Verrucomicrobiae bacterium]